MPVCTAIEHHWKHCMKENELGQRKSSNLTRQTPVKTDTCQIKSELVHLINGKTDTNMRISDLVSYTSL